MSSTAYVYITTNLVNGMKYVGKHNHDGFDPNIKGYVYMTTNDGVLTRVHPDMVEQRLSEGWTRTPRKCPSIKGLKAVRDRDNNVYFVDERKYEEMISSGKYEPGGQVGHQNVLGRKWVHRCLEDGSIERKIVPYEKYVELLEEGWEPGSAVKESGISHHYKNYYTIQNGDFTKTVSEDHLNDYLPYNWVIVEELGSRYDKR